MLRKISCLLSLASGLGSTAAQHWVHGRQSEAEGQLRPHMKTHKSKKIAHMQLAAGAVGLTCAKISEAEVMVEAGVHDLFIAYPMYGDYQLAKAAVLAKRCRLTLACDSLPAAQKLDSFARAAGITFRVSMIVDTGTGRDGVLPEQAVELAKQIAPLENLALRGVMTRGHLRRCSVKRWRNRQF